MIHRVLRSRPLLLPLVLATMVLAGACGAGGPEFTPDQATALIMAQWPEAELELRNAVVDEQGRGVAYAGFDGEPWEFYFQPQEEGTWVLEAVKVDGGMYYLRDLEQISATMLLLGSVAGALEEYRGNNGSYPVGDSPSVLLVLIPDYIAEETERSDPWGEDFSYESDGESYTMISSGADKQMGTLDDIRLHDGEFIGASSQD